eukprot:TRINITY_DN1537_c0_g1_i6.p1 TRINITY_DN1537_c0_g1~~TRINITY_DN1537_c0_g1_i6.p1  ORF type:complete len:451 (-),score=-1.80 TRINITY_DN1537_c0_g1_i6:9-1361(-)
MEDFDAEFEKEFDPVLDFSEGNKKLQEEEDKSLKDSFLKVYDQRITPQINQRIQSNICLIKCKAAHLSSSKQDCIFVATTDGYLYLYTLECNPSEAKCNILSYNPETDSIELDNRPFMGNSAFHLVGLKTWQFSGQITKLSFTKIYNSFQGGFTRKAFKRSNSFHDSNYESNDTLICAGLVNNKVALFPLSSTRTNQTMNELSVNRSMSEVFILNIQVNVLVFILFKQKYNSTCWFHSKFCPKVSKVAWLHQSSCWVQVQRVIVWSQNSQSQQLYSLNAQATNRLQKDYRSSHCLFMQNLLTQSLSQCGLIQNRLVSQQKLQQDLEEYKTNQVFTTKDKQVYFYYNKQRIFFYQSKEPVAAVKVGKMKIYKEGEPVHCIAIVSQNNCVTVFYDIVLYEYRKHKMLKKSIEEFIKVKCEKLLDDTQVGEAAKNFVANFLHSQYELISHYKP